VIGVFEVLVVVAVLLMLLYATNNRNTPKH